MTRTMYDAITPQNIPAGAQLVAGYADGRYANMAAMAARFPRATRVGIAVSHTTAARVLDVESGDATPQGAVQWCTQTMAAVANHELTVYCNTDTWPLVRAAFQAAGVAEPQYWIAHYDGDPAIPDGAVAKQYKNTAGYDVSSVRDYWPGVDPAPAPARVPQWRQLLDHVMAVREGVYEHWVPGVGWDNHTVWGVEYGEDGVPYCVIGAWDEFHECGLDKIVPRTDNVNDFAKWARANGEWTQWPSIGAWADFGDGAHCEIVIGFTATTVTTKGWNSVQTGSTDAGQGNGVWVHTNPRSVPTGYLAPRFGDGACPPTANPHDPRGGTAQASYTWPGPATPAPTPLEDDMRSFTVTPGGALCGASFPRGSARTAGFFTDNTFIGGQADPGATLRVVVWASGKAPEIHEVVVGNKNANQTVVTFSDPANTHTVTVTRTDKGAPYPVFAEIS
ncbi:hypothetical protein [Streptomyces mirabilis]|uniref:hypothetical protein n=1 Tax=Streptomyces mirabilis TaxID=68239 RepID=UPI0036DDE21C